MRIFYPMPTLEKLTTKMKGAKFFSILDIKNAFYHVELHEDSRRMTTFMTSKGLMRFTRLAFGVNAAPEIFQKIMEEVLRDCRNTVVYVDDILVFGSTIAELEEYTKATIEALEAKNLTLNREKCEFNKPKVRFHDLTMDGISVSDDRVKDIQSCGPPTNPTELRSFLGLVTYLSDFIPELSSLTGPLRNLLKDKGETFKWGKEQDEEFEKLKALVASNAITRAFFDEDDETWLFTDALPVGLGAVLLQKGRQTEVMRPIALKSKALAGNELSWAQAHREAAAVAWGTEKFHYYLFGREFNLVIDHKPLDFIFRSVGHDGKRAATRAEGFALRLSCYRFKIHVTKGKHNITDFLSRRGQNNADEFTEWPERFEINSIFV
jgi:hypothetical protein